MNSSGTPRSRKAYHISFHAVRDQRSSSNPGGQDAPASVFRGASIRRQTVRIDSATAGYEPAPVGRKLGGATNAPVDKPLEDLHAMRKQADRMVA